eukprot:SAG31_NODE_2984_length_4824_cov_183.057143_2_plen_202_part_00
MLCLARGGGGGGGGGEYSYGYAAHSGGQPGDGSEGLPQLGLFPSAATVRLLTTAGVAHSISEEAVGGGLAINWSAEATSCIAAAAASPPHTTEGDIELLGRMNAIMHDYQSHAQRCRYLKSDVGELRRRNALKQAEQAALELRVARYAAQQRHDQAAVQRLRAAYTAETSNHDHVRKLERRATAGTADGAEAVADAEQLKR